MSRALPNPYQGPPQGTWYGHDSAWRIPLQAAARRRYGTALSISVGPARLVYRLAGLTVTARPDPVPVTIVFDNQSDLVVKVPAWDLPSVYADPGASSKHRNHDGSLCLYYPGDPLDRRWHSELGLEVLLKLVADHLFAEMHWRDTGGHPNGEWVLDEAPHGYPEGGAR